MQLMRKAYTVRSTIAHGSQLRERDLRLGNENLTLEELFARALKVVRLGLRKALEKLHEREINRWPVEWEELLFTTLR